MTERFPFTWGGDDSTSELIELLNRCGTSPSRLRCALAARGSAFRAMAGAKPSITQAGQK